MCANVNAAGLSDQCVSSCIVWQARFVRAPSRLTRLRQDLPHCEFTCSNAVLWQKAVLVQYSGHLSHGMEDLPLVSDTKRLDMAGEYDVLLPCWVRNERSLALATHYQ